MATLNLPSSSFVPFATHKLRSPIIAWTNPKTFSEREAIDNAYSIRTNEAEYTHYSNCTKVLQADRYGGLGNGFNGGSARCGSFYNLQIKGVGLTPLFGENPSGNRSLWHNSGQMSASDAVREAIWSHICAKFMPYGAIHSHAIVLPKGQYISQPCDSKSGTPQRRAVLIREFPTRPGHFLRNLNFQRSTANENVKCDDSVRTSNAFQTLPKNLAQLDFNIDADSADIFIKEGLVCIARRYARQIAASFARRIHHRALSCANISIDGRYLDFGTMTVACGFHRQSGVAGVASLDFWNQEKMLCKTLESLRTHAYRYMKPSNPKTILSKDELAFIFLGDLRTYSDIELIGIFGFPFSFIEALPSAVRLRTGSVLREIIRRGSQERFTVLSTSDPKSSAMRPLHTTGRYNLSYIVKQLSMTNELSSTKSLVSSLLGDKELSARLSAAYEEVFSIYLLGVPKNLMQKKIDAVKISGLGRNEDLSEFAYESINANAASIQEDGDSLNEYISSLMIKSEAAFAGWDDFYSE